MNERCLRTLVTFAKGIISDLIIVIICERALNQRCPQKFVARGMPK